MTYLYAFLVGGAICAIGQLILDFTNLTPGHMLVILTVAGAIAGGLDLYQPLIKFAGAGAITPVSGFGASIARGALMEAKRTGLIGLFTGVFEYTGMGIAVAVFFGALVALVASPKT
ncbi:MAG: stage V sporulation protein AE [Firmicutes bacterium]|nr:stage V sporulation protein AE [Bacillota bacterium]MDH7495537.1 stage V sporulation protein AE [Bacillota bacterium]